MKNILSILLLFFSVSIYSQKNKNLSGYIVTNNNDTVQCMFKPRNWKKQPTELKISINGTDTIVNPSRIRAFAIPSLEIECRSMAISPALYELDMQFANNDAQPFFDSSRTVFIKLLCKGSLSLYLYVDPVERKHFLIEVGDGVAEIYRHRYTTSGGFHYTEPLITWYNQYIYKLKAFMTDCSSLYSTIDAIELKEEHLIDLLKKYDLCRKEKNSE